jgi:hypothetical protein
MHRRGRLHDRAGFDDGNESAYVTGVHRAGLSKDID